MGSSFTMAKFCAINAENLLIPLRIRLACSGTMAQHACVALSSEGGGSMQEQIFFDGPGRNGLQPGAAATSGDGGLPVFPVQHFSIHGRVFAATDPGLQLALASIHDDAERPRCLCVAGGVEMYVARHRKYVVKRMPETGKDHHPSCPSYEPDAALSGLGELVGEAVLEPEPGRVELRVDFGVPSFSVQ